MIKKFRLYFMTLVCVSFFTTFILFTNFFDDLNQERSKASTCGRYPEEGDIFIDNIIWQVLQTSFGFVYLLNAYLDERWNRKIVRVNIVSQKLNISSQKLFCQFWFDEKSPPSVVEASEFQSMWFNIVPVDPTYFPYLITCPVTGKTPLSVSLTLNPCDNAENNLKIIDNQPLDGVKKEFGVCVKQLTYPNRDFIIRFIEWVHMLQILGNSKVHVFIRFLHPEMMKVIKYFERQGLVETNDFLEPSCMSNDQLATQNTMALEHAILNDCFYKVKNLYKYVAILDPDEIIMPVNEKDRSWQDLFKRFNQIYDVYPSRMIFYPEFGETLVNNVPSYFYMLTHVEQLKLQAVNKRKSFLDSKNVIVAYNHGAFLCFVNSSFNGPCQKLASPNHLSHVNHYRNKLHRNQNSDTITNTGIWRFKDELMEAVKFTLNVTKFVP